MRFLFIDIDTLRPDHLGCYGYHRATSPAIDALAAEGTRFENCYVSDAPCLPSRTALWSGRFGFHTGVVNHGGINADPRPQGPRRQFKSLHGQTSWMSLMRRAGLHTVTFSPFAERHSAFHWYAGFAEMHNSGKSGHETADEIVPDALDWLGRNGRDDSWFLHVNTWDPHTPYRTPMHFGNPFEGQPIRGWLTEEMRQAHYDSYGPHSAQDVEHYGPCDPEKFPRLPRTIASMDDYRKWIDGYDTGIRYADEWAGALIQSLKDLGVYDDTVILMSSDHGESQGELNIYGDHQLADHTTSRVPLILKGPGLPRGRVDSGFHYQTDIAATIVEMAGQAVPDCWDGRSFWESFSQNRDEGRDCLVLNQAAWSCQRSARFGHWILIRTYDSGLKDLPPLMLFNVADDPHETTNLAEARPDLVGHGLRLIDEWVAEMMAAADSPIDPLFQTLKEGGPFHTRGFAESYAQRLRETGRAQHARKILDQLPPGWN